MIAVLAWLGGWLAHPAAWAAGWAFVLACPLLAWGVSMLLVGQGPGPRSGRAAMGIGTAVPVAFGFGLVFRFIEALSATLAGGPLGWFNVLAPLPSGWSARDAILVLALVHAILFVPTAALITLVRGSGRGRSPFRVPMADAAAVLLLLSTFLGLLFSWRPYSRLGADPALLDLASLLPMAGVALAIWTRSRRDVEAEAPRIEPRPVGSGPTPVGPDVTARWRSTGVLDPSTRPLVTAQEIAGSASPARDPAAQVWKAVGVSGPPPGALSALDRLLGTDGQAWLLGDLPHPTDLQFLVAVLTLALGRAAQQALVICDDPSDLRDRVQAAIRSTGNESFGSLVAGEAELRAAFAGRRLPAAAFMNLVDLSTEGIRALSEGKDTTGALWCRNIGFLVVSHLDRGSPLDVTHRMWTLRRLALTLRAEGARWSALATGFGGVGTRMLLERVFPGLVVRDVPLDAAASALVRVWRVDPRFAGAPGPSWVRRALEPLARAGLEVGVSDPRGTLDARDVEVWGGRVSLRRDLTLEGRASAAILDEAWMVAAFRALRHRTPCEDGAGHDVLWDVQDNPVTRFLLRDGNLAGLHATHRLPPPRPLVGYNNPYLAQAHLRAALREGERDVDSLAGIFGRPLVDAVLGSGFLARDHVVREVSGREGLQRVPVAAVPDQDDPDPLRRTITGDIVRIVDVHGGRLVLEADRATVRTRFYPQRVFSVGPDRFRVPLNALDEKRGELRVELVPADRALTRPRLGIALTDPVSVEAMADIRQGALAYRLGTFEVSVVETVDGLFVPPDEQVSYDPVVSRYRTRVRGLFLPTEVSANVAYHLARMLDAVMVAHLFVTEEDIEVISLRPGAWRDLPAGLIAVDRQVDGMGMAEALDREILAEMLRWVEAILAGCPCPHGCEACTPREARERGPDKMGVLRILRG